MRVTRRTLLIWRASIVSVLLATFVSWAGTAATGRTGAAHADAPAQLKFYYWSITGVPRDLTQVQSAINQYILPKINAQITLEPIDVGSYDQRMKLINTSGQPYDLAFAASWINNYDQLARTGAIIPLDHLLQTVGKKLYATMPPRYWDAARVNGKIYGVLNQSFFPTPFGVIVRKDLATKYDLDLSKVKSYADLTPFLAHVKKDEPGVTPIFATIDTDIGEVKLPNNVFDGSVSSGTAATVGVRVNDSGLKAMDGLEIPEFKAAAELARKWYLAGYYGSEPKPDAVARAGLKAGQYAVQLDQCRPETAANQKAITGYDWVCVSIGQPVLTTGNVKANLLVISRTSQHPQAALELLQLFNTDKYLYNLICFGIQGKHWVWVDKSRQLIGFPKGVTAQSSGYNPGTPYMFGDVFNSYYNDPSEVGQWTTAQQEQAHALLSPALGFDFDTTKMTAQIASVSSVLNPCVANLLLGLKDTEPYLDSCVQQAKAAGLNTVLADMQRQLDAFKATKH